MERQSENSTHISSVALGRLATVKMLRMHSDDLIDCGEYDRLFVRRSYSRDVIVADFDYESNPSFVISSNVVSPYYIAFFVNSIYGFYLLVNPKDRCEDKGAISLARLKSFDVPLLENSEQQDLIFFEQFVMPLSIAAVKDDISESVRALLSFMNRVKNGIIMELLDSSLFEKYDFSLLKAWHEEVKKLPGNKLDDNTIDALLDSIYSYNNPLMSAMNKLKVMTSEYRGFDNQN